ncbi:hypothetical protein RMA95_02635 [Acinetobacter sp. V110_1]|uniref:Uncharacterized protein n=1 Tax=Acinetobacter seifertii TaxID=1530123 RepID=A0A7H2NKD5_9GAMM|nr:MULTISPECIES: hypothetical protein [Acinetobacter]MBU3083367.1 hypothetical protein [Acinetobacter seifertii]MBZ6533406.1 hypothetical protein [Acinetobacter seifertii]MDS7942802.1 hypothetical protein [Acinetobacter sp. V110_1]QNW91067.1 hypothetical protein IC799_15955 [Acinetobacter seifertii]QNW97795.1 hypothetical protein IC797_16290 [Acinetobacter seifertii]
MAKNRRTKNESRNNFFEEFIDQLITAIFGELFIYIIALLFMSAIGGIIFAAIFFSWGVLFLLLPFAVLIYILFKKYSH